ncbi:hypothetical protein C1Y40_03451 [Mycobacterium talmoniae]|uniref:Uncharacterized protein n=1 Tax=Mycobacterium talmoniae TaxID=1858794 RepID=A0A2S8BI80_9MYCO|nr:hypothetical protein C1Y40_03451 [Mycobacterium talmoniae]
MAGAQQPPVQPLVLDPGPGQRGRLLHRPDLRVLHRPIGEPAHVQHVVAAELVHVAVAGLHPHPRADLDQIPDDVTHRRVRPRGPQVTQADPRADAGQLDHQWPNRVGHLARHPRQAGDAPAVRFDRALGAAGVPADQPVQVQEPVEVPGLVLQHSGEQAGALQGDRAAVGVEPGDFRPRRPAGRERLAGHRQAAFVVVVRVGHGLGDLGGFQHRVDHHAAAPRRLAPVVGAVVDEQPQPHPDLVGRQPDAVGDVHGLVQRGDQLAQIRRQRTVGADRHRCRRGVQDGIAHDADGNDCHDRQA